MSDWVSVADRLPKEELTVLCKQVNSNNLMLCYLESGIWKEDYQDLEVVGDGWVDNSVVKTCDTTHYLRITHWMYLPEPPK